MASVNFKSEFIRVLGGGGVVGALESCKMKPCSIPSNRNSASGSSDISSFHTCKCSVRLGRGGGCEGVVVVVRGLLVLLLERVSSFTGRFLGEGVSCLDVVPDMSYRHVHICRHL